MALTLWTPIAESADPTFFSSFHANVAAAREPLKHAKFTLKNDFFFLFMRRVGLFFLDIVEDDHVEERSDSELITPPGSL